MYLKDLLLGLRRRWYLVVVGLLMTAGLAVGVGAVVAPQYTTTTSLLLLPPKSGLGTNGNPYLNLSGLSQALEVLSTRVNASDENQALMKEHPEATVTVGQDATSTGPILLVSATAPTAAEANALRDQVTDEIPAVLERMQTDLEVRANSQITLVTLASDQKPLRSIKDLIRGVIVVAALGAALTLLVTGYVDSVLLRRRGVRNVSARQPSDRQRLRVSQRAPRTQSGSTSATEQGWDLDLEEHAPPRALTGADSGPGRD